jgi:vitamin B12 transporter
MSARHIGHASAWLLILSTLSAESWGQAAAKRTESLEEVIVSANRFGGQRIDATTSAATVLSAQQLQDRQTRIASDLLRDVPGVQVNRTGTVGGLTQVRMRGAEGNHTLVLLDGQEMSDPFQGEFDFAGLLGYDIARVEVLRGQQSALYGSDAIGGVVNYILRRGAGDLSFDAMIEGGTESTGQLGLSVGAGEERFDYLVSAAQYRTDGINVSRFGSEDDGARNTTAFINAGWRPIEALSLRVLLRRINAESHLDPQDFAFPARPTQGFVIDGDSASEAQSLYATLSADYAALDGRWTTRLSYATADVERDSFSAGMRTFATEGQRNKASLISSLLFSTGAAEHRLTAAADFKREKYLNVALGTPGPQNRERELDNTGVVANYDLSLDGFALAVSLRHDDNDRFQNADTYRVGASYRFAASGTRLRVATGTGIKAPTNFELFGFNPTSFIGNPDLDPERSRGWDLTIEQPFLEGRWTAAVTYFDNELEDEIFTTFLPGFVSSPRNRSTLSTQRGVELTLDGRLTDDWSVNVAVTDLDATENGLEEVRRPPRIASLNSTLRFAQGRASTTLTVRYNGTQQDSEFINATPATRVTLPSYTLVNLSVAYDLNDRINLYGRIENLLDEDYEEVFTFRTPGRAALLGARFRF